MSTAVHSARDIRLPKMKFMSKAQDEASTSWSPFFKEDSRQQIGVAAGQRLVIMQRKELPPLE